MEWASDPELRKLRAEFLNSLQLPMKELEEFPQSLADPQWVDRMKNYVHKIAGSAETFGFKTLGEIAEQIDEAFYQGLPTEQQLREFEKEILAALSLFS